MLSVLVVNAPDDLLEWPVAREFHQAKNWKVALEAIHNASFDCVLIPDERAESPDWPWLPPIVPLSLLEPVREVRDPAMLRFWLDQVLLQRKLEGELARTREELRSVQAAERELFQALEFSPIGSLMVTRRGRIVRANQKAAALVGRSPREMEEIPLAAFVPPEDIDLLLSRLWSYLRGDNPRPWRLRLRRTDGQIRSLQVSGQALPDAQRVQLSFHDLTEELELRERLRALQAEMNGLLDELADGILIADHSQRIITCNRAAEELLGYPAEELQGCFWQKFGIHVSLDSNEPQAAWFSNRSGRTFLAEFRVRQRRDLKRTILVLRDLSPFRRARQELAEIRERERAVLGQELHDDLGQILTALSFLAETLATRLHAQESAALARQISALANESIGKTRALARGLYPALLDRGGLVGALQDLVGTTEEIYQLPCRLQANPPELELDRRLALHMFRIAQEAITNAVKHSHCSQLDILLQADGRRVWMEVRDDGRGIGPDAARGEGLGLRSMRQHAELMEGGLELESVPGEGTSVCCWAPIAPK